MNTRERERESRQDIFLPSDVLVVVLAAITSHLRAARVTLDILV